MNDATAGDVLPDAQSSTGKVFRTHLDGVMTEAIGKPSSFLEKFWSRYPQGTPVVNGNVFEVLISVLLYRQGLKPLYQQATIAFVPNVIFDLVLYTKEYGPVVLSIKTSLREQYKQVDLEGTVLRNVHRRARTYLITANKNEAASVNRKITGFDVQGIEKVVYAFGKDMDELVVFLRQLELVQPGTQDILTAGRTLI